MSRIDRRPGRPASTASDAAHPGGGPDRGVHLFPEHQLRGAASTRRRPRPMPPAQRVVWARYLRLLACGAPPLVEVHPPGWTSEPRRFAARAARVLHRVLPRLNAQLGARLGARPVLRGRAAAPLDLVGAGVILAATLFAAGAIVGG